MDEFPRAIPGCHQWRIDHPEPCGCDAKRHPIGYTVPAPYCPSAYCDRCRYYRTLDGVPTIEPNEWMEKS